MGGDKEEEGLVICLDATEALKCHYDEMISTVFKARTACTLSRDNLEKKGGDHH